jgi:hypothetical protein
LDSEKLAECVIRIDERLKLVSEDFHELRADFIDVKKDTTVLRTEMTNHLSHHQMFEETLPILTSKQLVAYTGGIAAVMVGAIELFLGILGGA